MTQEEKAKAYDDLLVKLQKAKVDNNVCDERYCCVIDDIVPELKESGDERIRKVLLELINTYLRGNENGKIHGVYAKDILAWLEKQGEQKHDNKFEPKFKVGDKIRIKTPSQYDKDMQVARIESYYYICNHIGKFSSEVVPFSKESSYELIEQNHAWSEEDKAVLDALIRRLEGEDVYVSPHLAIVCLKSLKDRVQSQLKQEWSEEDEVALGDALWCCKQAASIAKDENDMGNVWFAENWLKSLKDRYTWKPSEEHLHWLKWAINRMPDTEIANEAEAVLEDLLEELLKL